jgi:hypothetical protein
MNKKSYTQGYLHKEAENAYGNPGYNIHRYTPINKRRELSPVEEAEIERAKGKILPKIFKHKADPIHADMYSPLTDTAVGGLFGAGAGGLLGAQLGGAAGHPGRGAAIGASLGALLLGIIAYNRRAAKNMDLEEMTRRLPEGALRRDMHSDPVYQAEMDRNNMMAAAALNSRRYF